MEEIGSEPPNTEKIERRLSVTGQKRFYATMAPDGAADIFGIEEAQAQDRTSMKPPVPRLKPKQFDVQLLKQKDRFLTKNGLKDFQ